MRRIILLRAARALAALLIAAAITAIASPAFRDFVGDDTLSLLLIAVLTPLLVAADKAVRTWKAAKP